MLKMRVHGWMAAGVTFDHDVPPFIVTWILPSSVPAQMTLMSRGERARAVIAPRGPGLMREAYWPALDGGSHVCRARSGLTRVHVCAWSADRQTASET